MRIANLNEFDGFHNNTGRVFAEEEQKLVSGADLKRFRKLVGSSANNFSSKDFEEVIRTYKLQLDLSDNTLSEAFFNDLLNDYNTISSTSRGSLFEFWATLLLSGFRIYRTATEAQNSYLEVKEDDDISAVLEQVTQKKFTKFTIQNCIAFFKAVPRGKSFDLETIKNLILTKFGLSKENHPNVIEFVNSLSEELFASGSWAQCFSKQNEVVQKSLSITSDCLERAFKLHLPKRLESFLSLDSNASSSSTLVLDKSLPVIKFNEKSALYALISLAMSCYPQISKLQACLNNKYDEVDLKQLEALKKDVNTHIEIFLLSAPTNCDGLHWLFNSGIPFLDDFHHGKISFDDLAQKFHIPSSLKELFKERLQKLDLDNLPKLSQLDFGLNYFRKQFGVMISSWSAVFIDRVFEIASVISVLKNELKLPEIFAKYPQDTNNLFKNLSLTEAEVTEVLKDFKNLKFKALQSIQHFLGLVQDKYATQDDVLIVQNFKAVCDRALAIYNSIDNAVEQFEKHESDNDLAKSPLVTALMQAKAQKEDLWHDWTLLREYRINKINTYNFGLDNPFKVLQDLEVRHNALHQGLESYLKKLERIPSFGDFDKVAVTDKDLSVILNRIVKVIQKRNDVVSSKIKSWFIESQIIRETLKTDPKTEVFCEEGNWYSPHNANRLLKTAKGALFVSPYANKKVQAYELSSKAKADPKAILKSFDSLLKTWNLGDFKGESHDTLLKVTLIWGMVKAAWLADDLEPTLFIDKELENLNLAFARPYEILVKSRPCEVVRYTLNAINAELMPVEAKLQKRNFYLNLAFKPIFKEVGYLPKKSWKIPAKFIQSLNNDDIVNAINELLFDGHVDNVALFKALSVLVKNKTITISDCASLLIQAPHDWVFRSPIKSLAKPNCDMARRIADLEGKVLTQAQGKFKFSSVKNGNLFYRLAGPSSIKSLLDGLLTAQTSLSEVQILPVVSSLDGKNLDSFKVDIALIIKQFIKKQDKQFKPTNIIGIDQGEFGIAFTVMPIDYYQKSNKDRRYLSGFVKINSFKALIKNVKKYRANQKPVKFTSVNSTMFQIRENVVGDVVGVIAALMFKFNAYPILENNLGNLESGSKALQNVYKQVNSYFLADNIDAHNNSRRDYWYKGNAWERQDLIFEFKNKDGKTDAKTVIFRPGFAVRAANTSKICHVCGRNPFDLLYEAKKQGIKEFEINAQGEIVLDGIEGLEAVKIKLYQASKAKRPNNMRAALDVPLKSGKISWDNLKNLCQRNLRRAPRFTNVKDSSQSRYHCVFVDCKCHDQEQHADINASFNIANRFLQALTRK